MEKFNFHSHTYRCGHAVGSDENYVEAAIQNKYHAIGFSDHTPVKYYHQLGIRMKESDLPGYIRSVNELKEKYGHLIEIYLGLEVEYFPHNIDFVKSLLVNGDVEYLLLGQHFYLNNTEEGVIAYRENDLSLYIDDVIKAIETGIFLYIAHPDHYGYFYHRQDEHSYDEAKRLILKAKEYGVPLELNISKLANNIRIGLDMYNHTPFPVDQFWQLVGELGADVVIGLDAHTPLAYFDSPLSWADEYIKKYNLHILTKDEVIDRMNKIRKELTRK